MVEPIDSVVPGWIDEVDHLVFAVPRLGAGTSLVEELLGVKSSPGGRHVGLGTYNRLVGLGPGRYLEVVSVDPGQPTPDRARWFGLDDLTEPRLVTWCARASSLQSLALRAGDAGLELGEVVAGSRERPDGVELSWRFTDPRTDRAGGVVPFFIDWGESPHPSEDLTPACALRGLRGEHPEARLVEGWLEALGLDMTVSTGHAPRLVATLDTPNGPVELS